MNLIDSVANLKNVGNKREELLNKMGVYTIKDLINYYPKSYDDRSVITPISELDNLVRVTIRAKVVSSGEVIKIKELSITRFKVQDETGIVTIVFFNKPYMKNTIVKNDEYVIYAKVNNSYKGVQLEVLELEKNKDVSVNSCRIVPIYKLVKGISQKVFRSLIYQAIEEIQENINDFFGDEILKKYELNELMWSIKNVHYPISNSAFYKARERLAFNELFLMQGALYNIKVFAKKETHVKLNNYNYNEVNKILPYKLTNAQNKVINEIINDLKQEYTMNRLVQGDVGSGKTVVALITAYISIINGYQAVIMAPTEVLATQHFNDIKDFFEKLNITTVMLSGSLKASQKKETLELVKNGTAQMIVGTHALIQKKVEYNKLGLVITDEQHRFGVRQRGILSEKGVSPHMLVMTATPIPRTLGLILFGDLDISIIDELPPGRQPIETYVVDKSYENRLNNFITKEVENKRQVYVICPTIETNEESQSDIKLKSVKDYAYELKENLKQLKIAELHGKMKPKEKEEIMISFAKKEIDVLVATTVIEVGINVPNATLMIIQNSDRFGLSQLHQLRGRVGRGKHKSYCILCSDNKSKISKERLSAMISYSDGFLLSEKDMKLRGHGDFFGNRQHGIPEFKIANLYEDIETLKKCQNLWIDINENNLSITNNCIKKINDEVKVFYEFEEKTVYL